MATQHIFLLPMSLVHLVVFSTALTESSLELHFLMSVLPVNTLALQQQLGDGLGLCQHLHISLLDVNHEVGAHTRHRIIGHGITFLPYTSATPVSLALLKYAQAW